MCQQSCMLASSTHSKTYDTMRWRTTIIKMFSAHKKRRKHIRGKERVKSIKYTNERNVGQDKRLLTVSHTSSYLSFPFLHLDVVVFLSSPHVISLSFKTFC